jgi:hypothetical protein
MATAMWSVSNRMGTSNSKSELRVPHCRRLCDQLVDRFCVAAVPGPQRLDLGEPALVLGDDPRAALVRDVEQRALELARKPLQVLGPLLHARGIVGGGC